MFKKIIALILMCLSIDAPFAFAEVLTSAQSKDASSTIIPDGTWHSAEFNASSPSSHDYFFRVEKPSEVVFDLRPYTEHLQMSFWMVDNKPIYGMGPIYPNRVSTLQLYFNPGVYIARVGYSYLGTQGSYDMRVLAKLTSFSEKESNDTMEQANRLSENSEIQGALAAPYDIDYFIFTLSDAKYVDLDIYHKDNDMIECRVSDKAGNTIWTDSQLSYNGDCLKKTLLLPAGTYYLALEQRYAGGMYRVKYSTRTPPVPTKIKLPKSVKLTKGFAYTLSPTFTPGSAYSSDITWSSSKNSVATVEKNTGVIMPKNIGKTTLTVKTGKLSAKTTVTVVDNVFNRKNPLKQKYKGIYVSTKKMYYKGDSLYLEVFVFNKTGRKVAEVDDLYLAFYDLSQSDERPVYKKYIGSWNPGKNFKNNSYKVFKTKLSKSQFKNLDLASGQYQALIVADFYVKGKDREGNEWISVLK